MNLFYKTIQTDIPAQIAVRKWIAALRSGKYSQTDGRLRRGDGFCCLGVACDVLGHAIDGGQWVDSLTGWEWGVRTGTEWRHETTALPRLITRHLHMTDSSGGFFIKDGTGDLYGKTLADENDQGQTFGEIADIIEDEFNLYGPFPEIGPVENDSQAPAPWRP